MLLQDPAPASPRSRCRTPGSCSARKGASQKASLGVGGEVEAAARGPWRRGTRTSRDAPRDPPRPSSPARRAGRRRRRSRSPAARSGAASVSVAAQSRAMLPVLGGIWGWMSATWSAISRRGCAFRAGDRRAGSRSGAGRPARQAPPAPRPRGRCAPRQAVGDARAAISSSVGPAAEQLAEIEALLAVEAEEQRAVRGEPAAVAGAAERRGGRGDDAEPGPVGAARTAPPAPSRPSSSGAIGPYRPAIALEDLALRHHLIQRPSGRSADVHVLDEPDLDPRARGANSSRSTISSSL